MPQKAECMCVCVWGGTNAGRRTPGETGAPHSDAASAAMNCPSASIARAARMLGTASGAAKGTGPGLPGNQTEGEFKAHFQARLRSSPGGMAFSGRHKGRPSGGVRSVAPRETSRYGGALRRFSRSLPPPFLSLKRTEKLAI